jgi:hypothetical protein
MKIGNIVAVLALLCCLSTIVWSMRTRVQRVERKEVVVAETTKNGQISRYEVPNINNISVRGFEEVVLDPAFSGIEIMGDSAVRNQCTVWRNESQVRIFFKNDTTDRPMLLKNVVVRVGLMPQNGSKSDQLDVHLGNSAKVTCTGSLNYHRIYLGTENVQASQFAVQTQKLSLSVNDVPYNEFYQFRDSTRNQLVVSGRASYVKIRDVNNVALDLRYLAMGDCYGESAHFSDLFFGAAELVNLSQGEGTNIKLEQPPKYQKIRKESGF